MTLQSLLFIFVLNQNYQDKKNLANPLNLVKILVQTIL